MKKVIFFVSIIVLVLLAPAANAIASEDTKKSEDAKLETYIEEYDYPVGYWDGEGQAKINATLEVKRLLLEKIGTYVESNTVRGGPGS